MSHSVHLILSPGTRLVTRNDANRIGGDERAAGILPADSSQVPAGRCGMPPWPN